MKVTEREAGIVVIALERLVAKIPSGTHTVDTDKPYVKIELADNGRVCGAETVVSHALRMRVIEAVYHAFKRAGVKEKRLQEILEMTTEETADLVSCTVVFQNLRWPGSLAENLGISGFEIIHRF